MKTKGMKIALVVSLIVYGIHSLIVASQAASFVEGGLLKDPICQQIMLAEAFTPHLVDRAVDVAMIKVDNQIYAARHLGFYDKMVRSAAVEKVFRENCRGY